MGTPFYTLQARLGGVTWDGKRKRSSEQADGDGADAAASANPHAGVRAARTRRSAAEPPPEAAAPIGLQVFFGCGRRASLPAPSARASVRRMERAGGQPRARRGLPSHCAK